MLTEFYFYADEKLYDDIAILFNFQNVKKQRVFTVPGEKVYLYQASTERLPMTYDGRLLRFYFEKTPDPKSPDMLTYQMIKIWDQLSAAPDNPMIEEAIPENTDAEPEEIEEIEDDENDEESQEE
jgi:hypothetical protein